MNTLIIDTSIAIKWINKNNEENIKQADKILEDARRGKVELLAPELLKYEIGNVLLKGKQLSTPEAFISLGTAYSLPITFVTESEDLARETYYLAIQGSITYYDAAFLSLAKAYGAVLVTENIKHQGKSPSIKAIALKDY